MKVRVVSALIIALCLVPILLIGGTWFTLSMMVLALMCLKELFDLKKNKKSIPAFIQGVGYLLLFLFIVTSSEQQNLVLSLDIKYLAAFLIAFLLPIMIYYKDKKYTIDDAAYVMFSVLLLGLVFSSFIIMRNMRTAVIIYLLVITISADTFAHLGGSLIGKHKLLEPISPKKTMEGAIYGVFMAVVLGSAFYKIVVDYNTSLSIIILITFVLSIGSVLGDLIFSAIKRNYKQKDFSNLIPGHGGLLDRIDSLVLVVLIYVILVSFL